MSTTFDELYGDNSEGLAVNKDPIWVMNLDDPALEDSILSWVRAEKNMLVKEYEIFFQTIKRNSARYRGIQYESQENRQSLRDRAPDKARAVKKISVNLVYDLVEQLVSRQVKYKPAIQVLPATNDYEDKTSAKVVKNILDHIWYTRNFENDIFPQMSRAAHIMREAYLHIYWNPDLGNIHPDYKEGQKQPLLNAHGSPVTDLTGNQVMIEDPVKIGDVDYEVVLPECIFPQKKQEYKDVEYLFRKYILPASELRLRYPEKAAKIKGSSVAYYDYNRMEDVQLPDHCYVWELWHKGIKPLQKGRKIVFTDECILENGDNPSSDRDIPFIRLTNLDMPGDLRGESFIHHIAPLVGVYNNITNMLNANVVLAGMPKWMMPAGAARKEDLGNALTIVEFKGPTAPALVSPAPFHQYLLELRQAILEEIMTISGVSGVSRGEPPKGITAAVALQFLSEQENERFNSTVIKTNEFLRQVAIKTISVCSDFYDDSDKRMIRVLGKMNQWQNAEVNLKHLQKEYDIICQNSSALPQSKAARLQTLMELNQQFPDKVTSEQVIDMLDLAQDSKFYDEATVAVRAAEEENEKILSGVQIVVPMEYENHFVHWKVHSRIVQEPAFKWNTPPEIQRVIIDHIMATEMLMVEKAKENMTFAQKLITLELFPLFYKPEPVAPPMMGPQGPMSGPMPGPMPGPQGPAPMPMNTPIGPVPDMPVNPKLPKENMGPGVNPAMPQDIAPNLPSVETQIQQ